MAPIKKVGHTSEKEHFSQTTVAETVAVLTSLRILAFAILATIMLDSISFQSSRSSIYEQFLFVGERADAADADARKSGSIPMAPAMMTLRMFETAPPSIPYITASYLSDLGVSLGKQELFTKQSPQKLKALREHALIESAVSSNRIEGVTVDQSRVATIVFGKPHLRDRDEEEVRG